jgi:hypothetical protein
MPTYNVHIYREMRLAFGGIEADSPEAAASFARDKQTGDADDIDDCDGETFSALVDVAGDEEYSHSRNIDFEPVLQRTSAPKMLDALKISEGFVQWALDHGADSQATGAALALIRTIMAEAEAAGIRSEPSHRNPPIPRPPIHLEISEDAFDDHYPLKVNHLNPTASWAWGDDGGCLFESYGEELDYVRQQPRGTVWTFVDGDESDQYLLSGFHFVNRIGYLISTVPVPDGVSIEVRIPSHSENFENTEA